MATLTYNNSGISFNNVTSTNTSGGTFIGKEKIFNQLDNNIDQETLSEYGLVPIVQALQIDWNGMVLGNGQVINSTGDFASYTSTASTTAAAAKKTADKAASDITQINSKIANELASINYVNEKVAEAVAGEGTVAAIKINGTTKNPVSGVVDLGNVLTAVPSEYVTETELAAKSYITTSAADNKYQTKGNYLTSVPSEYVTETKLAAKSYITTSAADNKYQTKGNYLTSVPSEYVTETELSGKGYITTSAADNKYQTKGDYITETKLAAKSYITTSTADNKYQAKGNYLTSVPSEYVTESELSGKGYITTSTADGKYQTKGNYLTSESDPIFKASAAAGITSTNISNWNTTASNVSSLTTTTNTLSKNYIKGIKLHSSYYYTETGDLANILDLTDRVYHKSVVYTKYEVNNRLNELRNDLTASITTLNTRCNNISSSQSDDYNYLYGEIVALQQRIAKLENGETLLDPSITVSTQNVSGSYYNGADVIQLSISGVDEYDYLNIKPSIPLHIVNNYGNGVYEYEENLGTTTSTSLEFMYDTSTTLYLGKGSDNSTMSGTLYITASQTDTHKSFSKAVSLKFTDK